MSDTPIINTNLDLYTAVIGDQYWPMEKRTIYCAVTGRPWGIVTEDYVREAVTIFGEGGRADLARIIDRITLFNGPSPLWQSKVPNMLIQNKSIDPYGFLVYMLNNILKMIYEKKRNGDLDFEIQWRKDMIKLYADLRQLDKQFIDRVNDTLLLVSGEGCLPMSHALPSQELLAYGSKEILEMLIKVCRVTYNKRHLRPISYFSNQPTGKHKQPNPLHMRTATQAYSMEEFNEAERIKMQEMMLMNLFQVLDKTFTVAQTKAAKERTGIASPMLAILKEIEHDQKMAKIRKLDNPDEGKSVAKLIEPGKFKIAFRPKMKGQNDAI